jgi:hypothetical protein
MPEEIRSISIGVFAPQLQGGALRDSDMDIKLGDSLGCNVFWKISVVSVNAVQTPM